jgi:transcription initiation factor TFIIIB Brf1 subunit/transcription initiation factor TFIIB
MEDKSDEPTGHFTGRCSQCGSDDLWDDNDHYGCNSCGAILA